MNWWVLLVFLLLGAGCSHREPGASAEPAAKPSTAAKLVLFSWEEYFAPEAIAEFEKESGIAVDYQTFGEVEEIEARLKSRPESVDVVVVDSFNLNKLRKLRLLHSLDKSLLPNFKNIAAEYQNLGSDPNNEFSVPYMWGTTLLAYRKDKIPDPGESWELLWSDRYRGKVMMLDDSFDPLATAMLMQGKRPDTVSEADYKAAAEKLIEQIHAVQVQYGSDSEVKERLKSGEVWAAMCYSGDAAMVAGEVAAVDYFIPREGAPKWLDSFAVARDSKAVVAAHAFINHMMKPEMAARNSNVVRYATPNMPAEAMLDDELRKDPRIYPPADVLKRCMFLPQLDAARESLVNRSWHAVKRAYSEAQASGLTQAPNAQ
jgi:spermidine/putrescine transport system substrate-binding protein